MELDPGHARMEPDTVMAVLGGGFVVLGGLIAAVTGPLSLEQGSWLAAYVVLVCGVAQFAMGTAQAGHAASESASTRTRGWVQLASLTLGNAAVVVGTLVREPLVVDGGVAFLVLAFGIALYAARASAMPPIVVVAGLPVSSAAGRFLLWMYRLLLVLLVVSLPVGSVLAHLRAP